VHTSASRREGRKRTPATSVTALDRLTADLGLPRSSSTRTRRATAEPTALRATYSRPREQPVMREIGGSAAFALPVTGSGTPNAGAKQRMDRKLADSTNENAAPRDTRLAREPAIA
jgi:hypothetical protein